MALHSSSYESLYDEQPEPPKRKDSSGVYLVLLVVAAVLLGAMFIPSLRARVTKFFPSETSKKVDMAVQVWANKRAGSYYCPGSQLFGHGAGKYMSQGNALTLGYQPALGQYCQGAHPSHSNGVGQEVNSLAERNSRGGSSVSPATGRR